jgi:hypothetical protein
LRKPGLNQDARWAGSTVVCIASGPSLTAEDVAYVLARKNENPHVRVIAVNREFESAPWADVCYGADFDFWYAYIASFREKFKGGEAWTMSVPAKERFGINCIGRFGGDGYSIVPGTISTGGNSGYQAVHLAAYWGAKKIVMLGYDMQRTGGKEHHYGIHAHGLRNGRNFPFWIRRFTPLLRDLKNMGIEVLNCTRKTALTSVPRTALDKVPW